MDVSPLAIIFVKNGSGGDRLLFKYPFAIDTDQSSTSKGTKRNPFSVKSSESSISLIQKQPSGKLGLSSFSDKVMSNLFAVSNKLSGAKFELKVNDIRFVGHPVNLEENDPYSEKYDDRDNRKSRSSTILLFNIVFALKAIISYDVVYCYYDLSRRLGIALAYEEKRCRFLSEETKTMIEIQDEASQQPESTRKPTFELILDKCLVAQHLKQVYEELCNFGTVNLRLNNWLGISFCLPQKINHGIGTSKRINYQVLMKGLKNVKPYHTLLLLTDRQDILKSMSVDVSPSLRRLLHVESPISPFYTLAADADLTLSHVLQLAGHLVYWGKAKIIYPVCNTNIYVLSPHSMTRMSKLAEKFQEQFPGRSYLATLSEFSLPISLRDKFTPMFQQNEQQQEKHILFWLLKHGLLQQLHTYIYLSPLLTYKVRPGPTYPMTRGPLEPVAEAVTERALDDAQSDTNDEDDEVQLLPLQFNGIDKKSRLGDLVSSATTIKARDASDSESLDKRFFQIDDTGSSVSLSSQRNVTQSFMSISHTPSESDLGSVCSDDRSLSPGVGNATDNLEEAALQELSLHLTPEEKEMVLQTPSAKNLEDLKLFASLCRYFRGEHHMEEIMYYANIHRSLLLEILDKFRLVLITMQRFDPSIAFTFDS